MTITKNLSWSDISMRADRVVEKITLRFPEHTKRPVALYGVPRGGVFAALAVRDRFNGQGSYLVEMPEQADVIVDDIIDSGNTKERYVRLYSKPFFALVTPDDGDRKPDEWISFPWERMNGENGPQDAVTRLIEYIGEDPQREGLRETPKRVVKAYDELFSGYGVAPSSVLKCFEDDSCDEMVILTGIEFVSMCEHHMLPFIGSAHIAYIPNGKVVGISKLARLLEVFTRRLQIQERICQQVTNTLMVGLEPKGAACVLEAKHLCMTCRGVNKQQSIMITSSLEGVFRNQPVREEFLAMVRMNRC